MFPEGQTAIKYFVAFCTASHLGNCLIQVKFFLNASPSDEDAEPVHVATEAPFMMGIGEDGEPKRWEFAEGEVSISAQIIPASEDDEEVTVTEAGTAFEAGSDEVRSSAVSVPILSCSFSFALGCCVS